MIMAPATLPITIPAIFPGLTPPPEEVEELSNDKGGFTGPG